MDIKSYLAKKKNIVDRTLDKLVPPAKTFPQSVHEAMRYSLFAGGKRVRPILAIAAAEALGAKTVRPAAHCRGAGAYPYLFVDP